jgi:carbon storage regulator
MTTYLDPFPKPGNMDVCTHRKAASNIMEDFIMLVLSRKPGEKIQIGSDITITVIEGRGNKIRIGIEAPEDVPILRAELNDFLESPSFESFEGRCPVQSGV